MKNMKPTRKSARIPKRKEESVAVTSGHSKASPVKPSAPSTRGRKRQNANPTSNATKSPKIRKNRVEGREVDGYCWICHKTGHDEICKFCPRVYHTRCIPSGNEFNQGKCPECQAQSVNKWKDPPNISRATLKVLLKLALQEALREDVKKPSSKTRGQSADNSKFCKYFKTWPQGSSDLLCQIVDLEFLIEKMNDDVNHYLTTAQFFADVKWIYHNCLILHGPDSDITETALKLEKNFKSELMDIEACTECYSIMHSEDYLHADFFAVLCRKPHDVVWAKLRGSPYWPAKCLKIFNGHADVRFFGTHDKSTIPISQCFRISQRSPNERDIKQTKYQEAIRELSIYVSNYQRMHGSFPYFLLRTPLDSKSSKNVKKSHRKGRRKRSSTSDRDDMDDSENSQSEDNDKVFEVKVVTERLDESSCPTAVKVRESLDEPSCSSTIVDNIQNSPVKMAEPYDSGGVTAKFESPAIAEPRIDSSDIPVDERVCSNTTSLDSTATEPVSVCMEFSTDDEATSFNSSSKIMTSTQPTQSAACLQGSTSQLPQASSPTHFVNSSDPDLLPVITSAVSTGILSEDRHCFTGENPIPESSENIRNMFVNGTNISGAEIPSSNNILSMLNNLFNQDDDVQIILENRTESGAVNAVRNSNLAHALCQIATSNRPHLQKFYSECLDFAMRSYLHLGLPSALKWQEESAVIHFTKLYEQVEKSGNILKKENESLKHENATIKQENDILRQEIENLQGVADRALTKETNLRTVIDILRGKTCRKQLKPPPGEKDIPLEWDLQCQVDELKVKLAKLQNVEAQLKEAREQIRLSENQPLPDCVSDHIDQSVEGQTDLSASPDNQMFASKDIEVMNLGIPYGNCSESQEEEREVESPHSDSSSGIPSQIYRQHTFTTTTSIQHNNTVIMYNDGTTSSVQPIYDTSLVMPDCSLVQPITAVPNSFPLLMTDGLAPMVPPSVPSCRSSSRAAMKGKKRFLPKKSSD